MGLNKKDKNKTPKKKRKTTTGTIDECVETPKRKSKAARGVLRKDGEKDHIEMLVKDEDRSIVELWLIQIPSHISDLDSLTSSDWSMQRSTAVSGAVGTIALKTDREYKIHMEEDALIQNTVVVTQSENIFQISKAVTLHRLSKREEEEEDAHAEEEP